MHPRNVLGILAVLVLIGVGAACSSSTPKASPAFSQGLERFYSAGTGTATTRLDAAFTNCVANHLSKDDQAKLTGAKTVSLSHGLADAVTIRVVRASDPCDHAATAKGIQARILEASEEPFHLTSTEKSCVSSHLTSTMSKLDDTKVQGSFSVDLNTAITQAFSKCIPLSRYIGGLVLGQSQGAATAAQAKCVGDAVAKSATYQDLIDHPDTVSAAANTALSACGVKQQ